MKCFRYFLSHFRFSNLFVQVCTFKSSTSLSKPLHVKFINQHNQKTNQTFVKSHCITAVLSGMKLKYVMELRTAIFVDLVIICCLKVPSCCD